MNTSPSIRSMRHRLYGLMIGVLIGSTHSSLLAAPGTLSSTPLYLSTQVEPNIVFIADDSQSMDWSLMTDVQEGIYVISNSSGHTSDYKYAHPTDENLEEIPWLSANGNDYHFLSVPRQAVIDAKETLDSHFSTNAYTGWQGVWRTRSHDYNRLYYNPNITYKPWLGVDINGNAFIDSPPGAALLDPYLASTTAGNTVDLTSTWTTLFFYPSSSGITWDSGTDSAFFPAYYNAWTDSNANDIVDETDAYTTVTITPSTPSYTGSSQRSDCAAAPVCSYAEEIQNFANWFSYYRRRALGAKNAMSSVIAGMSNARMGYVTINNNTSINLPVASMNLDPTTGNKKSILDRIFTTPSTGSTPLRSALQNVGEYYEQDSNTTLFTTTQPTPILSSTDGGVCQHNFSVIVTDGYYNGLSTGIGNADGDGSTVFDGGSYGDSISDTLADIAMHYYERDLQSGLADQVPTRAGIDEADHQHMVTFGVSFGVNGTLDPTLDDPTDAGFVWPDPQPNIPGAALQEKVDDLWHATWNGRGRYLNALDPVSLSDSLLETLSSIVARSSSAAAVAFNSTTLGTGSVVYLARFNSATWGGELLAHELDPFTGAVAPLPSWNSATQMDSNPVSTRTIYTYNNDTKTGVPFRTLTDLSAGQQADLNTSSSGGNDGNGQARLDYLRGSDTNEGTGLNFRIRNSRHGDIVHSNPVYVGRPLMSYPDTDPISGGYFDTLTTKYSTFRIAQKNREGIIYVGANDGMLHGFHEDNGDEVMAFIPGSLYSTGSTRGLHYLTDPAYIHQYYVDLSPTVSDAHVKTTPTGSADWHTILIGGLRSGGRGIFALDITDPTTYSDSNADNVVMWEFTSNDDADMGYSFSKPTIALMNNDRWAAIFGNGYNHTGDYKAKLFIAYLDGGLDGAWVEGVASLGTADENDYMKIEAHNSGISISGADPNGLSTPQVVDLYANGRADWIYAGDLKGNMWVFDVTSDNADNWDIAYSTGQTPKPLFTAMVGTTPQPITAKPIVIQHPTEPYADNNKPNLMVYFGTGQFLVEGDKTSTGTQTMYGVWDKGVKSLDRAKLVEQTLESGYPVDTRVTTDLPVNYGSEYGWYIDLPDTGERIVVNPKIRGKLVFFNTLVPNSEACSYGGGGWLMAVKQENGGPPDKPVYDFNNDGIIDDGDRVGTDNASPGGIKFDEGLPAESNFLGENQYTPGSSGELQQNKIDAGIETDEGRLSWKEIIKQ